MKTAELLITKGADVHVKNRKGLTPLGYILKKHRKGPKVNKDYEDIMALLKAKGATE